MCRLIILAFLLAPIACGQEFSSTNYDVLIGTNSITEAQVREIVAFTNTITPDGKPINMDGITIEVVATKEELYQFCTNIGGDDMTEGCLIGYKTEFVFANDNQDPLSWAAMTLGHELGHVFYPDRDGNHTHTEWFDKYDHNSIMNRTAAHFVIQ